MRIRKHANLSSLRTSEIVQQHVCHLSMSPWDLDPFPLLPDGNIHPNLFRTMRENEGDAAMEEKEAVVGNRNGVVVSSAAAAAANLNGRAVSRHFPSWKIRTMFFLVVFSCVAQLIPAMSHICFRRKLCAPSHDLSRPFCAFSIVVLCLESMAAVLDSATYGWNASHGTTPTSDTLEKEKKAAAGCRPYITRRTFRKPHEHDIRRPLDPPRDFGLGSFVRADRLHTCDRGENCNLYPAFCCRLHADMNVHERVEKEEQEEEKEKKKIVRRKAAAAGVKSAAKKKPEVEEEEDDDYKPPIHLSRLKPKDGGGVRGPLGRRRRRRKKEEGGAFSPNMDFYYYSGFGPLWCKKRGEHEENSVRIIVPPSSPSSASAASEHDDDERRRDEVDDVDGGDCEWEMEVKVREKRGGGGRRKKVKARSLKTLL
ncbi:hypothetical protein ACLOJK_015471 [Asimina triloba]